MSMMELLMKRIALLVLTLCISFSAAAQTIFEEGVHYKQFSNTGSNKPQLTEYFSFYCPHCYRFEKAISQIKADLPKGVKFNKSHVDNVGLGPKHLQGSLTLALAIIDKMKLSHTMSAAIFNHIHVERKSFKTTEDIRTLFVANAVDGNKFDKALKNFSVKTAAKRMKKGWNELPADIRQIGVPSLIVNNKYWINAKKLKGRDDYQALIAFLVAKKD